jgi:dihydroflavonol-4-reductase
VRIPYAVALAAGVATTAWARVTGIEPRAPLDAVRMAKKKMWVSHAKAARELGFQPGPVEPALARAIEWFRSNGYVA